MLRFEARVCWCFSAQVPETSKIVGDCNQFPCSQPIWCEWNCIFCQLCNYHQLSQYLMHRLTTNFLFSWLCLAASWFHAFKYLSKIHIEHLGEKVKQNVKSRGRLRERGNTRIKKEHRQFFSDCLRFPVGKSHIWTIFGCPIRPVSPVSVGGAVATGHEERKIQLGRQDHSEDLEADRSMVGAD